MDTYYKLLGALERRVARLQGKGWGAGSVEHELSALGALLGRDPPVRLAVDVGGNVGNYAAAIRAAYPTAEVHVFEPARTNLERLRERFADDAAVTVQPFALAAEATAATLYSDMPGSGLASLTRRRLDHRGNAFDVAEPVRTRRFDAYWRETLGERTVDLLKLDIEGHELDALAGCGDALARTRAVQFEFGGCNIDTRTFFQDFWYFFGERGFDLYRITPRGVARLDKYRERDEFFSTTNYIALARRRHPSGPS